MRMCPAVQVIPIFFQSKTDPGEPVRPCQMDLIAGFYLPVRRPATGGFRIFTCWYCTEKKTIPSKAFCPVLWEQSDAARWRPIFGVFPERPRPPST